MHLTQPRIWPSWPSMKSATISETKNKLSELLAEVRAGETLTIYDRKRPVATVVAVRELEGNPHLISPAVDWAPEKIVALPRAELLPEGGGLWEAVAEERQSGW